MLTVNGLSIVLTTRPPHRAWAAMPRGCSQASRTSDVRRGVSRIADSTQAIPTTSTRKVTIRLPNSMAMLIGEISGCATGSRLSGVQLGQVGQPSPDSVTRTTAPLTVMPALTTTEASAQPRIVLGVGVQKENNRRARGGRWSVDSFTSSMLEAG